MQRIFNPTENELIFVYDSKEYRVLPNSSDVIDYAGMKLGFHYEHLVKHVKSHVNGPFQIIDDEQGKNVKAEYVAPLKSAKEAEEEEKVRNFDDLEDMRWKDMTKLGSELGVYKPGTNRQTLEAAIRKARGEING